MTDQPIFAEYATEDHRTVEGVLLDFITEMEDRLISMRTESYPETPDDIRTEDWDIIRLLSPQDYNMLASAMDDYDDDNDEHP